MQTTASRLVMRLIELLFRVPSEVLPAAAYPSYGTRPANSREDLARVALGEKLPGREVTRASQIARGTTTFLRKIGNSGIKAFRSSKDSFPRCHQVKIQVHIRRRVCARLRT